MNHVHRLILWAGGFALLAYTGSARAGALVSDESLRQLEQQTFWRAQLPLPPGDSVADAFLVDEVLYITSVDGVLSSLTADAGLIRWAKRISKRKYHILNPSHVNTPDGQGPVMITTSEGFRVLDRYTGKSLSQFQPPFAAGSGAVAIGHTMFVGGANGQFYSLIWKNGVGFEPLINWHVQIGDTMTAMPVLYGGDKLLFASWNGKVYSCFARDRAYDWQFSTGGAVLAEPVVDDTGVYVASTDRSLYKVDPDNGSSIWRHRVPVPLRVAPVIAGGLVYQFAEGHGLEAIDKNTGEVKWHLPEGRKLAAQVGERDVVVTSDGLSMVDRHSGRVISTAPLLGRVQAVTNVHSDATYLVGESGEVVCIRPAGVPYLRPRNILVAREKLNQQPSREAEGNESQVKDGKSAKGQTSRDPFRSGRSRD